mmetsp:Transcript_72487/g.207982  ORF Transcript_72487/g.207982 Transcript_72487/m.207982 type:complete len:1137 (-) Transcript_72487:199-3609(-)
MTALDGPTFYRGPTTLQRMTGSLWSITWVLNFVIVACAPLQPPVLEDECGCVGGDQIGWNPEMGMCMKGPRTTCEQCAHQQRCAMISAVVGDGIRAFQGDCRSSTCSAAALASLSYPSSLAIDEQDNLYIADHGNNRIRMLTRSTGTLVTISGSGELGFSGDGGLARRALLRKPEGLALKPGLNLGSSGIGRELYFSDYHNQRIRKLVLQSDGWHIYSVSGTGAKGDNPDCDVGCDALAAMFSYPRALAFSSSQDLYIVDSGNLKIRKLTTSVFPDQASGILSTFIGSRGSTVSFDRTSEGKLGSMFLPGSWAQANAFVSLGMAYHVNIDHEDNLWFTDSTNVLWMAPLKNSINVASDSAEVNIYADHYMSAHAIPGVDRSAMRSEIMNGFAKWIPIQQNRTSTIQVSQQESAYRAGTSYWMYAQPVAGNWCPSLNQGHRAACAPANAQFARFQSIMGFCFDAAGGMYLADTESSELLFLSRRSRQEGSRINDAAGRSLTTQNCPCLKYWHTSEQFCPPEMGECREMCRENPDAANKIQSPDIKRRLNVSSVADLPPCATSNYCSSNGSGQVEWCYIERATPVGQNDCGNSESSWGFCGKAVRDTPFVHLVDVAVLGHEMRQERLEPDVGTARLTALQAGLNLDMWMRSDTSPTSTTILAGFVYIGTDICAMTCCGLSTLSLETEGVVGTACMLKNITEFGTLHNSISGSQTVTLVFLDMSSLKIGEHTSIDDCMDKCRLQESCKSFMVGYNGSTQLPATPLVCFFFKQNHPYNVYRLDRSGLNETLTLKLTSENMPGYRRNFGEPLSPHSRFFNLHGGIYVSDSGLNARDMIAEPQQEAALSLSTCQDLCISRRDCFAIAYPGCYLLSAAASTRALAQLGQATITMNETLVSTAVYVKQNVDDNVQGITGFRNVHASSDNGLASEAYLNRPGDCIVDSKGIVHFADVWNQQVRQVSGFNLDCLHSYRQFDSRAKYKSDLESFVGATAKASESCSQAADMRSLHELVFEQRSPSELQSKFCNFTNFTGAPTDTSAETFYTSFTRNTMVLCRACQSLSGPQPKVCPPSSMCTCHADLAGLVQTQVFKQCQAPSSLYDPWHIWATSFLSCWWQSPEEAEWFTDPSKRTALQQRLESYR